MNGKAKISFGLSFLIAGLAQAAPLAGDELLLLYNAANRSSRELAEYYAKARGVPTDRLVGLRFRAQGPFGEELLFEDYDRTVRNPVRAHIEKNGLRAKVRCVVTFYGLPLRVSRQRPGSARARLLSKWQAEFQAGLTEFETIIGRLNPAASRPARKKDPRFTPEMEFGRLRDEYLRARQTLADVVQKNPQARAETARLLQTMTQVEGLAGVVGQVTLESELPGLSAEQFNAQLRRAADEKAARVRELLTRGLDDPSRDEARRLLREVHGLIGLLNSLATDIEAIRPDETESALDSELALLWHEGYVKYRWVVNPMCWRQRAALAARGEKLPAEAPPVLMVSRIDGPTPAVARGLIDKALAAEQAGVSGTVYVDARGFRGSPQGVGEYDEYLRRMAELLKSNTSLRVVLDDRPELFQPGQCPDTLLYCGWYSVRKYVEAFTFAPGAVAYHIASFEAATLKAPADQGWCKRLLEAGVTATLGPVAEPYLHTFPRPDDFFALLLTGRFTLAEVYAYTVPFHSWMMTLIGDPLYRPFGAKPALALEQAVPAEILPAEFRTATKPAGP